MIHGQRTSAYATFSSHIRPAGQFARVYGTRNTLDVDYLNRTVTLASAPELPSAIGRLLPPFQDAWQFARAGQNNLMRFLRSDFHYFAGMNRLFALFYASIIDQTPVPVPYRDILRISAMMEEIFRQIEPQTEQQIDAPQDRRTIRIVEEREIQA
jgi:predicted dehydrogenase